MMMMIVVVVIVVPAAPQNTSYIVLIVVVFHDECLTAANQITVVLGELQKVVSNPFLIPQAPSTPFLVFPSPSTPFPLSFDDIPPPMQIVVVVGKAH